VQQNLESAYSRVMDVSHPNSAHYGKHWANEDVEKLFAPSAQSIYTVRSWLAEAAGLDIAAVVASSNGWLTANMPISTAERVFSAQYYEHQDFQGRTRIGCDEYHLPEEIQYLVDYIVPGVKSSPPMREPIGSAKRASGSPRYVQRRRGTQVQRDATQQDVKDLPAELQGCGENITPACIRALYHIPRNHHDDPANTLGIFAAGDVFAQSDLDLFYAAYAPYIPQGTAPKIALIDGAEAPVAADDSRNQGESDLDLSMALSLIYPQSVVLYQTDDVPSANLTLHGITPGFLNTFLDALDGSYCKYTYDGLTGNSPGIDPVYPDSLPGKV
jgi:tripeptidyl-peptidase I